MIKKILILIVLLGFGFQVNAQETYTDKEIGFDREQETKLLKADNISDQDLEITLSSIRSAYVASYEAKNNLSTTTATRRETTVGCGDNIGFEQGFINWCYTRFQRDLTSNGNPNPGPGNDVPVTMIGNTVCDNLNTVEVSVINPIPLEPAAPDDLDLSSFSNNVVKLGRYNAASRYVERVEKTIEVTQANRLFSYRYAVVLQDPGHQAHEQPYFRIFLQDANGNEIPCSRFEATSGLNTNSQGFIQDPNNPQILFKQPAVQTIDLINQGINPGQEVTIIAEVADCTRNGHYGLAYFEGFCAEDFDAAIDITNNDIEVEGDICLLENNVQFKSTLEFSGTPQWSLFNNDTNNLIATFNTAEPSYNFTTAGNFRIELTVTNASGNNNPACNIQSTFSKVFQIVDCNCEDCYSFKPIPGDKYVLSAWVKEDVPHQVKTYENSGIDIQFLDINYGVIGSTYFTPEDRIIEGWQRIYKEFNIPASAVSIEIILKNKSEVPAYFDDIRIHPFNGNMKSFVYDPKTQRLMAELDENNYSTFYEYDTEGGLVRVKKETEKGVYTIQETRSKTSTKN